MPGPDFFNDLKFSDINQKYWFIKTFESTRQYCAEFQDVLPENQRRPLDDRKLRDYMYKVMLAAAAGQMYKIKTQDFKSVFPEQIMGRTHEYPATRDERPKGYANFAPRHLMYKPATMRDNLHGITYEFIIEYDIFHPDVEIYYGIKAISDYWNPGQENPAKAMEFLENVDEFYSTVVKPILIDGRNRISKSGGATGVDGLHDREFKVTNNLNNGTYWLFWIRVESNSSVKEALERLARFYEGMFRKDTSKKDSHPERRNAYTELNRREIVFNNPRGYARLLSWIHKNMSEDGVDRFKSFIDKLLATPYLRRIGQGLYCFSTTPTIYSLLIYYFFDKEYIMWLLDKRAKPTHTKIPAALIESVFSAKDRKRIAVLKKDELAKKDKEFIQSKLYMFDDIVGE